MSQTGEGAVGEIHNVLGRMHELAIQSSNTTVSTSRPKFGAAMNRLAVATSNIQTMRLNLSAANSRIS